jgi:hypothetical protein
MWEIIASVKQPGNQRIVNVRIEAPNQIVAKELLKAQYAGSDVSLRGTPREVKPLKPTK